MLPVEQGRHMRQTDEQRNTATVTLSASLIMLMKKEMTEKDWFILIKNKRFH